MMKETSKINLLIVLVTAIIFVRTAGATITTILPDSFTAPGTGQYIYAYQIFTDDTSTFPVEYFAIAGIAEGALAKPVNDNIGSVNDSPSDPGQEGIQPDRAYITSSSTAGIMGAWEFDDSLLVEGEHSYFLVLRSNSDWDWGTYTFSDTLANQSPIPNPEPCTIALLGIGMLTLLRQGRRRVR
jgi:hypothetical protein